MHAFFVSTLLTISFLSIAVSASPKVNKGFFSGVAIDGYDPVSYFTVGKAQKGKKELTHKYQNAKWRFANAEHLNLFQKSPEKYVPQYGGYCAYAVGAKNTTADIDPHIFAIHQGKLYLNYNEEIGKRWAAKKEEYILSGDKNWSEIAK